MLAFNEQRLFCTVKSFSRVVIVLSFWFFSQALAADTSFFYSVLDEDFLPHIGVAFFYPSQTAVDELTLGIGFGIGQSLVEEGSVHFVLPVVAPGR